MNRAGRISVWRIFTARNKNIYEGIGTSGLQVEIQSVEERTEGLKTVSYQTSLNSSAGEIPFSQSGGFYPGAAV